jgi:hypothetical protein
MRFCLDFGIFQGSKCPLCPIFPLRFFLIATLLQHPGDSTCAKVESLKEKNERRCRPNQLICAFGSYWRSRQASGSHGKQGYESRTLKLARTITGIAGSHDIQSAYVAEALQHHPKILMKYSFDTCEWRSLCSDLPRAAYKCNDD